MLAVFCVLVRYEICCAFVAQLSVYLLCFSGTAVSAFVVFLWHSCRCICCVLVAQLSVYLLCFSGTAVGVFVVF
jgi:hypothetical protein